MCSEGRKGNSVESKSQKEKNAPILCLKLLERSSSQKRARLSAWQCWSLKARMDKIMDDMASTMGTSGWTHVDASWVPRSKIEMH